MPESGPTDDLGDFDPLEAAERDSSEKATAVLLGNLIAGTVFLSPESSIDWQAFARTTDLVRVFVFCGESTESNAGLEITTDDCPPELRRHFDFGVRGDVDDELVRKSGLSEVLSGGSFKWLTRRLPGGYGLPNRKLLVARLNASPIELYSQLFSRAEIGPKVLCCNRTPWRGSTLHTALLSGHVGRPELLVTAGGGLNPPWVRVHERYPDWAGSTAYRDPRLPGIPLRPRQDFFNVELHNEPLPLRPAYIGDREAVHLTVEQFTSFDWGNQIQVFLDTDIPEEIAAARAINPSAIPLRLRGMPLAESFPLLVDAFVQSGCQGLSIGRLGFEDEASLLAPLWYSTRIPHQLSLFADSPSDFNAFLGYACEDLPSA